MRKRFLSILLICCMMLTLLPTVAFAEGTAAEVGTEEELTNALVSADTVKLKGNIDINNTLKINRTVTLDLNGHVLNMTGNKKVIEVRDGGNLTLEDSDPSTTHKFTPNTEGLWVWDKSETNGEKTVKGGVITGGKATAGGGVLVDGGTFSMSGGSIVGCAATVMNGGGVRVSGGRFGRFNMIGGSIVGCTANNGFGGGIYNAGTTTLSGDAKIQGCKAGGGGGIYSDYFADALNINDVQITGCTARDDASSAMYAERGTISGGTFEGNVDNRGTIKGGMFGGAVKNAGTIENGTFHGAVTNEAGGTISGGTFHGTLTNNGTIDDSATFAVTFKDGDNVLDTKKVVKGQKAIDPKPTKTGHTLVGWHKDDGNEHNFDTPVTGPLT